MYALRAPIRCARPLLSSLQPRLSKRSASQLATPPDTWLAPLVEGFLAFPYTVQSATGVPVSYAATIALVAIIVRGGVSLPVTIWSRQRSERRAELVLPAMKEYEASRRAELTSTGRLTSVAARRQFAQALRTKRKELIKRYRCHLFPTLAAPLLIQGSLFITTSLAIRYAVEWPDARTAGPALPLDPSDLSSLLPQNHPLLLDTSVDLMDGLRSCVGVSSAIARESWAWCPSLAQADPTYILPVLVGMASLACVEMAFGGRALISKAMALQSPEEVKRVGGFDTRRIVTNLISMAARGISIVFIPIAIEAPAAVGIYWLSSFTMTLLQNIYFYRLDQSKAARIIASLSIPKPASLPIKLTPSNRPQSTKSIPRRPV